MLLVDGGVLWGMRLTFSMHGSTIRKTRDPTTEKGVCGSCVLDVLEKLQAI